MKNIHPGMSALLPDKREKNFPLTLLKGWCSFCSPKIIKVDSEAEVVSVINKIFPHSVITGSKFHFSQCLWRHL